MTNAAYIATKIITASSNPLNGWHKTNNGSNHYVGGYISREDGPASIVTRNTGLIGPEKWWNNGKEVSG